MEAAEIGRAGCFFAEGYLQPAGPAVIVDDSRRDGCGKEMRDWRILAAVFVNTAYTGKPAFPIGALPPGMEGYMPALGRARRMKQRR